MAASVKEVWLHFALIVSKIVDSHVRILLLVVYRKRSIYNNKYDTYSQLSSILNPGPGLSQN